MILEDGPLKVPITGIRAFELIPALYPKKVKVGTIKHKEKVYTVYSGVEHRPILIETPEGHLFAITAKNIASQFVKAFHWVMKDVKADLARQKAVVKPPYNEYNEW